MKDPEFIALKNKFVFAIFVALLFTVPLTLFFVRSYSQSNALVKINNGETFVMLVEKNRCDMCKQVNAILKDNDVNYIRVNQNRDKDYAEILRKLGINNDRESFPIIVYIKDGKLFAYLSDINDETFAKEFIKNHNLIGQ